MPGFWSILNVTVEIEEVSLNPTMAQDTVARVVPMPPAHVTSNVSLKWAENWSEEDSMEKSQLLARHATRCPHN